MHTYPGHTESYPDSSPIHIWADQVEASAMTQLQNMSTLPFLHPHGLAVMPDCHAGIGSTVGTVIATQRAIVPAAVGVDIGCGMNAVRLSLKADALPDSLSDLRHNIERGIPLGPGGAHKTMVGNIDTASMERLSRGVKDGVIPAEIQTANLWKQLGTLGSGNHFIEVCLDEEQRVWVMLHSGSRGIGNQIGRHFIEIAKRQMERYFITLPDSDLAYLPEDTEDFNAYWNAVKWAQDYALENRRQMMAMVLRAIAHDIPGTTVTEEAIECHHNYVDLENHFGRNVYVTRKGAIRARLGDLGIIPGSMGQRSYIVRGKGCADSYNSCSHGAGRVMSRAEAKRRFTVEDLVKQTEGVECNKNASVIDEIPASYKDIDQVMEQQRDLVEVVHTLKQVLCIKGN